MSTTKVRSNDASEIASVKNAAMQLEIVVIPVSDVDRAKEFYRRLGWRLDADFAHGEGYVVAPPYGRSDRGRRDEDSHRREEVAPERRAPVQRTAPRPIPSIPNNPRPARQSGGRTRG
jgi:catechol 2,3-dioxygenase-like lactoylglutathione lyase family enzyme